MLLLLPEQLHELFPLVPGSRRGGDALLDSPLSTSGGRPRTNVGLIQLSLVISVTRSCPV